MMGRCCLVYNIKCKKQNGYEQYKKANEKEIICYTFKNQAPFCCASDRQEGEDAATHQQKYKGQGKLIDHCGAT